MLATESYMNLKLPLIKEKTEMQCKMFAVILTVAVVAIFALYANMAEAQIITDGLVSYWTFDETDSDGDTVKDVIGNNDGTLLGAEIVPDGKIDEAVKFNGGSAYIDCGNDTSLDITEEITIEAWIKLDNLGAGFGTIVGNWTAAADQRNYILQTNNDKLDFYYSPGGGGYENLASATPLTTDWTHVVTVLDEDDTISQYINGVKDSKTANFASPLNDHAQNFYIGKWAGAEFFNGLIDEVRIYNRALSEDEIKQNYESKIQFAGVEPANKLAITWGETKIKD